MKTVAIRQGNRPSFPPSGSQLDVSVTCVAVNTVSDKQGRRGICVDSWFRRVLVHQSGKAWQSSSVQVTGTCAGECSHRGSQGDRVGQELGARYKFQRSTTSDSLPLLRCHLLKLPELPQWHPPKGTFQNMSLWGTFEIQTLTACLRHKDTCDTEKVSDHPDSSVPFSKLERTPTFFPMVILGMVITH